MRRLTAALFALFLIGGLAACGASGGSDEKGDDTTTTTEATDEPTTTAGGDDPSTTSTTEATPTTSGSGGGDADEYVASLSDRFQNGDEGDIDLEADDADCIAEIWVDVIGVDRLQGNDIAPEDLASDAEDEAEFDELGLSESEAEQMIDGFDECGVDLRDEYFSSVGSTFPEEARACFEQELDDDLLHRLLVASLVGGDAADAIEPEVDAIDEKCGLSG